MVNLIEAKESDFKLISDLAVKIWNQHYVPIIGQQQVDYMLAKIYNYDSMLEQTQHKQHKFYLIQQNNLTVGFLSVSSSNYQDYFLHKFYIDQDLANNGLGTQVLQKLESLLPIKTITLTVNRQNFKSINFYFKNGFKIESVEDFDIGDGYFMNDFVMKKIIQQ